MISGMPSDSEFETYDDALEYSIKEMQGANEGVVYPPRS